MMELEGMSGLILMILLTMQIRELLRMHLKLLKYWSRRDVVNLPMVVIPKARKHRLNKENKSQALKIMERNLLKMQLNKLMNWLNKKVLIKAI